MHQFEGEAERYNIVSLGFFCGVAMELEKNGLRQSSLPFDWIISGNFASALQLIENRFEDFLCKERLYQESEINPSYYYNDKCNVHFYHDFLGWRSFDTQYEGFVEKYERRIKRFYQMIQEPTIFIRYCNDEKELAFIKEKKEEIARFLKSYNEKNKIIYIYSFGRATHEDADILWVKVDAASGVTNCFLEQLPKLKEYLRSASGLTDIEVKRNIKRYKKKEFGKIPKKISGRINRILGRRYSHYKQYRDIGQDKGE